MKIGLIGLPNSGKTTIFNALTKSKAEVTAYTNTKAEPNLSIVEVGDLRVTQLSKIYSPKKTTYATIEFVDFVGLSEGAAKSGAISGDLMNLIKNMDALAIVIRNFEDDLPGSPNPQDDLEEMITELLLSDLILVENRLERIRLGYKRGLKNSQIEFEEKVLTKIYEQLNNNRAIRDLFLDSDEEKAIRGYQFFTKKPFLTILNSAESNFQQNNELIHSIEKEMKVIEFAGKFEMELSQLDDEEDAQMFMQDMGIKESARDRLTQLAYEILGYISFFTVGADEVRAWNIIKGNSAVDAAAAIHSDLARGFIRAECFLYNDLIEYGSEKAIREKGRFRLEGKDYPVKDGDILSIRFNV